MARAPLADAPAAIPIAAPPGAAAHLSELEPDVRRQVRRTMRWTVVEGSFTQVFLNWTTGSVLVGYMLHLEASPTEIALVSSVPYLSQLASPFAAYLAAVLGHRRSLTAAMALIARATWLLAAALPSLPVPEAARPPLLIAIVLFSSLFLAATTTLWTAWMGDVVPERERGRAFGRRSGVMGVVGMAASLAGGAFLDRVAAPVSFQVVIVAAVASGIAAVTLYFLQLDPPSPSERVRWRELVTVPWRDLAFRRYLRFTFYWNFVVMLSGPFVTPYFLGELGMSFTQVATATAITAITALATTMAWGRVADRFGHKPVLMIGTVLVGLTLPSCWILAGLTGDLGWIWAAAVFDAVSWGAVRLAAFNLALGAAPRANRAVFIAMYGVGTGIAGFLGGALSGPLLQLLQQHPVAVWGTTWTGYHSLFAIALVVRVNAWWWLRSVPERVPVQRRPPDPRVQRGRRPR